MRKTISIILMAGALFSYGMPAFAGDVPESLLYDDNALVFFGEVVSCDTDKDITVLPTQKIKGDIKIGVEQTYKKGVSIGKTGFTPVTGEIYLMTYYNEANPLSVYQTTSTDTKTLKIKGIEGLDMWERMQDYFNEGKYEQAEIERLAKLNASVPATTSDPQNGTNNEIYFLYGSVGVFILVALVFIVNKQR